VNSRKNISNGVKFWPREEKRKRENLRHVVGGKEEKLSRKVCVLLGRPILGGEKH